MELLIVLLLLAIALLVLFALALIWKTSAGAATSKDQIEAVLSTKFVDFSQHIRDTMDSTRKEVERSKDVLSTNAASTMAQINLLKDTMNNLVRQQEKAQELGKSLEYLLQTPKLRGNYGETILEEMLDQVLPAKSMWERQYTIDGAEKVDAVVKYKDVVIPVDSKFPRDHYQRYIASSDAQEKKRSWSEYEKALKVQINSIKDKYIKPEKGTTEFALLFIPSEAIYYETIAEKNFVGEPCQIYEYAMSKKVIPVSPNTFFAFLQVIILGVRNIEMVKGAKKLQEILTRIERDYGFFYKNFEDIGTAIERASKAYDVGRGQVERFKKNLDAAIRFEVSSGEDHGELPVGKGS